MRGGLVFHDVLKLDKVLREDQTVVEHEPRPLLWIRGLGRKGETRLLINSETRPLHANEENQNTSVALDPRPGEKVRSCRIESLFFFITLEPRVGIRGLARQGEKGLFINSQTRPRVWSQQGKSDGT